VFAVGTNAHDIPGVAANEAVAGIDDTTDPGRAASPGHRPTTAVPGRTSDHIVAVAQGGHVRPALNIRAADKVATPFIPRVAADEAVAGIGGAADPSGAAPPRHRPAIVVPLRADDNVVAVGQYDDAEKRNTAQAAGDEILGVTADEAIASIDY